MDVSFGGLLFAMGYGLWAMGYMMELRTLGVWMGVTNCRKDHIVEEKEKEQE